LAGYPWFKVRARDLFISLPGSTLAVDRGDDFEKIMDSAIPHLMDFMEEKTLKNIIKQIDDPDVLLWAIWALQQYWKENKEAFKAKYPPFLFFVMNYILANKHPNLKVIKETGLVFTNGHDVAVSWMNAMLHGKPVVPRSGYLVEFNALWYNALCFAEEIAEIMGEMELTTLFQEKAEIVRHTFVSTFVNEAGYLYDYVDNDHSDINVRPNMIFAVSLDYSPLERNRQKSVIDYVTKELLSNCGIRTLSPKSGNFRPHYTGSMEEKTFAYFNGMAFPWLFGPYIEAYLKVFHKSGLSLADRIMVAMEGEMQNDCIGTISEMYDSTPPFNGRGGFSFAMSVAELLRALKLIKAYKKEPQKGVTI
jgi:predicted glycogen debranching enzyme